jgi:hypothetical protein
MGIKRGNSFGSAEGGDVGFEKTLPISNSIDAKPNGSEQRICSGCQRQKSAEEFFFKKSEARYEAICKACKKARRKNSRRTVAKGKSGIADCKSEVGSKTLRPKRIIEPTKITNDHHESETMQIAASADFSDLEKVDGKRMTDLEKVETVKRFNEFISLLREELTIRGERYVHIKKI